eukprot:PhF_6_TR40176/c1_g1_i12/m.59562
MTESVHVLSWTAVSHSTALSKSTLTDTLKTHISPSNLLSCEVIHQIVQPGQLAIVKNPAPVLTTPQHHIASDNLHNAIVGRYLVLLCIAWTTSMLAFVANILTCYILWGERSRVNSIVSSVCVFVAVTTTSILHLSAVDTYRMIGIIKTLDFVFIMGSTLSSSVILLYVAHAGEEGYGASLALDIVSCLCIAIVLYSGDACRSFPSWYRLYLATWNVILVCAMVCFTPYFVLTRLQYPEGMMRTFFETIDFGLLRTTVHSLCQGGFLTLLIYGVKIMLVALNSYLDANQVQHFVFFVSHPFDVVANAVENEAGINVIALRAAIRCKDRDYALGKDDEINRVISDWLANVRKLASKQNVILQEYPMKLILDIGSHDILAPTLASDLYPIKSVFGYRGIPSVRTKLVAITCCAILAIIGTVGFVLSSFIDVHMSNVSLMGSLSSGGSGFALLSGFTQSRSLCRALLRTPDLIVVFVSFAFSVVCYAWIVSMEDRGLFVTFSVPIFLSILGFSTFFHTVDAGLHPRWFSVAATIIVLCLQTVVVLYSVSFLTPYRRNPTAWASIVDLYVTESTVTAICCASITVNLQFSSKGVFQIVVKGNRFVLLRQPVSEMCIVTDSTNSHHVEDDFDETKPNESPPIQPLVCDSI